MQRMVVQVQTILGVRHDKCLIGGLFGARAWASAQVEDGGGLVAQARGVEVGKGNGTDYVISGFWVSLWG